MQRQTLSYEKQTKQCQCGATRRVGVAAALLDNVRWRRDIQCTAGRWFDPGQSRVWIDTHHRSDWSPVRAERHVIVFVFTLVLVCCHFTWSQMHAAPLSVSLQTPRPAHTRYICMKNRMTCVQQEIKSGWGILLVARSNQQSNQGTRVDNRHPRSHRHTHTMYRCQTQSILKTNKLKSIKNVYFRRLPPWLLQVAPAAVPGHNSRQPAPKKPGRQLHWCVCKYRHIVSKSMQPTNKRHSPSQTQFLCSTRHQRSALQCCTATLDANNRHQDNFASRVAQPTQ